MDGIKLFNNAISKNLMENRKFLAGRSNYLKAYAKVAAKLKRQEKIRTELVESDDLTVPPILITSVTNDCNLTCAGCYACTQNRVKEDEMTVEDIDRIVQEGIDLGVSIVMIAGGEPLIKKNILDIPKKYSDTLFVMFTNGLLVDDKKIEQLKNIKNLVLAFSLEGDEEATDARRGKGVYNNVMSVMEKLDENKIVFGSSITLTSQNFDMVINDTYLCNLEKRGCRAVFFIEYVPCNGDKELCLSLKQKEDLITQMKTMSKNYSMLAIPLPGDEEYFGGCLAAGRGFLHISSTGNLEACPFAPISDVSLKEVSLKVALKSRMLQKIRENHHLLTEAEGGCALYENRRLIDEFIC
ncbi:radical SAM protein [Vallitalea okinawensis]|uniref:radical SAM protein n=1 Tax=Vallitalea okinawensis TaxID=2078660 RepID=UPI000CFB937A|nr:radical SAM protein [Vallitalea okinawensis]